MSASISELGIIPPVRLDPLAIHLLEKGELYNAPWQPELSSLILRLDGLQATEHIPLSVIAYASGLSAGLREPFAIIRHDENHSAGEKAAILKQQDDIIAAQLQQEIPVVEPLKTVTLKAHAHGIPGYVFLTSIGDFRVDRQIKQDILPAMKNLFHTDTNIVGSGLTINPGEFNPLSIGVQSGIVSPFVRVKSSDQMKGVLYYFDTDFMGFVAVAASRNDTLIMNSGVFLNTLGWWQENHLGVPFKAVRKNSK